MSTTTEPGFMRATMSAVTISGAFLPGIAAVVISASHSAMALPSLSAWMRFSSSVSSRA